MYTISHFSRIGMVSAKTLRFYDEIELLKPTYVDGSNQYRYYSAEQVVDVLRITELKEFGFSLEEIKLLLKTQDPLKLQTAFEGKLKELTSNLNHLTRIKSRIETKINKLKEGDLVMSDLSTFNIYLKKLEPLSVVSIRKRIAVANINSLIGELFGSLNGAQPVGPLMSVYNNPDYNPDDLDLEVCIPVKSNSSSLSLRVIPGGTHACVIYQGPYPEMGTAYAAILDWIANNGYTPSNAPFEKYLTGPNDVKDEQKYLTEICFPVKLMA